MSKFEIDLKKISIQDFKGILLSKRILPSRVLLLDDIDRNFERLSELKPNTVHDLIANLSTPKKMAEIAECTSISIEYLTLLKREASSYKTKPVQLSQLLVNDLNLLHLFLEEGIKNSKQLFEQSYHKENAELLSKRIKQPIEIIAHLLMLCDLTRINGVGVVFAQILVENGIRSVSLFKTGTTEQLLDIYDTATQIIPVKQKVKLLPNDIRHCIEMAELLPPSPSWPSS